VPTAVINWPHSSGTSASLVVSDHDLRRAPRTNLAPVAQRFNGTGNARSRVLYGLACDTVAVAALRRAADEKRYGIDVAALEGFSEAQRGLHIWSNVLPERTDRKGEALRAYAEQLDRLLGTLARDHPSHLLVVVSPSGPKPPPLADTPFFLVRSLLGADDPGADDGFVLCTGPDVVHTESPGSAYEVDLVPTLLFAAGLPAGRDLDGRVLTDAFDDAFLRRNPLSVIATYEARDLVVRRANTTP
jgi:hypothetical protein